MSEVRPKAFITGASRGIGAETALALGEQGWNIAIGVNEKAARAQRVADQLKDFGADSIIVAGDLTDRKARHKIISEISEWAPRLGALSLNAAGGLEPHLKSHDEAYMHAFALNHVASTVLTDSLSPNLADGGVVVYVTSHWSHLYGKSQLPPFDRYDIVAGTKNSAENALRDMQDVLSIQGIRLAVVTGGTVEDSPMIKFGLKRAPEFAEQQRAIGNMITEAQMGGRIAHVIQNSSLPTGHTEVVGAPLDRMP